MKWMPSSYISVIGSLSRLKQYINIKPQIEIVSVTDAYKRVLAEDIISKDDVPAYNKSHMDGYAIIAKDVVSASKANSVVLEVKKESKIRKFPNHKLQNGQAYKISTGGYLPIGADTVIPIEDVNMTHDHVHDYCKLIRIESSIPKGMFVYQAGSDLKAGERILLKRKVLRAQDVGLLSSLRILKVSVFKRPRVAIIPTGSELTDNLESTAPDKIPNSNSHVISRLIEEAGAVALNLGVTPDQVKKISSKINYALKMHDIILTMAGSSVGEQDLVEAAVKSLGKPGMIIHGVKLDRGRVAGLASLKAKPIIVLPGPIQGAVNACIVFAYPLIRFLSGRSGQIGTTVIATLSENWMARKRFSHFTKIVYIRLKKSGQAFQAKPIFGGTESMTVLSKANGYVIVSNKTTTIKRGEQIEVHLLPGFSYVNGQFLD